MKILHFSDLHLGMENYSHIDPETGLTTRFSDWERTMQEIVDLANTHDADIVIFSGDAFKNRDPSPTYQNSFAKFIKDLSGTDRQILLLVGNHDLPNIEHKAHTLEIYNSLNLPRVRVSKKIESFVLEMRAGKAQVVTWPWLTRNFLLKNDEYKGKSVEEIDAILLNKATSLFEGLIEKLDPSLITLGVVHATVMGAKFGSERNVMIGKDLIIPLSVLANSLFSYVACGHLHKHQVLCEEPFVAYAGSPERIDFSEEKEEKGCVLITINENKSVDLKFLPTQARKFFTWRISDTFTPPAVNLSEYIVKIVISGNREFVNSIHLDSLQEYIEQAYYFAGIERNYDEDNRLKGDSSLEKPLTEDEKPEELLEKYLTDKGFEKELVEKVLAKGKGFFSYTKNE